MNNVTNNPNLNIEQTSMVSIVDIIVQPFLYY